MANSKYLKYGIFKRSKKNILLLPLRFKSNLNDRNIKTIISEISHIPWPHGDESNLPLVSQAAHKNYVESLDHNFVNKDNSNVRINEFGIQMVDSVTFQHLFNNKNTRNDESKINECLKNLQSHNLEIKTDIQPSVNLKLPALLGNSIEEHFYKLGDGYSSPYKNLILELIKEVPAIPNKWVLQSGWTRYTTDSAEKVDYPLEDALVFDVEVCCLVGAMPTIATAVSREAWYGWISDDVLIGDNALKKTINSTEDLIPFESNHKMKGYNLPSTVQKPRIVVGHNVSYDRSKIKEQYWLEQTGLRFLDTMSLHVCVSGVTSYQKALLKAGVGEEEWTRLSALNSLSKVHQLYCGNEISKDFRELFISGSLGDIKNNLQEAMFYCASDVLATHNVLAKIFPLFLERFPHPVTLAGMLELQTSYLPVNKNWLKYLSDTQHVYEDLDLEAKCLMSQCANDVCELLHNNNYQKDLWLWDQDWSLKSLKLKKPVSDKKNPNISFQSVSLSPEHENDEDVVSEKLILLTHNFSDILCKEKLLPSRLPLLPGYPEWYKKLCFKLSEPDWVPEPVLVGTGLKITPKLLRLTWKSLPVHHEKGYGWGFIVPYKTQITLEKEDSVPMVEMTNYFLQNNKDICTCILTADRTGLVSCKRRRKNKFSKICKAELGSSCGLVKLPHKDGPHLNVGNPLAKDFINKFSENALSADSLRAKRVIEINRMLSYWRNSRERIEGQVICWLRKTDLPPHLCPDNDIGAILPQVVVCGTLTRRAVEPTWMTASNASYERVGSELRAIVEAPPGYAIVGADVDSQELWIASLLGDAFAVGLHGATPLGWMTLNGSKSDGTDMHSVTAKAVGISRNHAKILNYARIYGAGEKFAQRLLKQFNEDITSNEAIEKAGKMMELTKGKKIFILKDGVLPHLSERLFSKEGVQELCIINKAEMNDLFEKPKWMGGTESAMFNCLEMIASKPSPETPFLNCKLSRALEPKLDQSDKNVPTRINWVVQSGAVDFLHLMLVCMRWFLGPKPRFCLSFHDEIRYLVPEEYKYEVALALHVTNLFTRAFCVSRLGMNDLPSSVAFFSSVEVDKVLRKESKDDNKTPSNPFGLSKGYNIPLGESLNIYEANEKAKGIIGIK